MPLYEYKCQKCELVFEVRQKFSDDPITTCRECDGEVKKLISQVAFALKGGGWYQQGYGSEPPKSEKKASPPEKIKSEAKPKAVKKECASCPNAPKS